MLVSATANQHQYELWTGRRQALVAGLSLAGGVLLPSVGGGACAATSAAESDSIYDLSALMYGEEVPFERYKGQVRAGAVQVTV